MHYIIHRGLFLINRLLMNTFANIMMAKEVILMKRTALKERALPNYSRGEETANMVTHIVGGGIGILVSITAIIISVLHHNVSGIVSCSIYGFTMIALYTVSSIYHGLHKSTAKKVMQVIDHCTIYFLIAGTYTPILLSAIAKTDPMTAWIVFGIEWGFASLGATLTAIDLKKYKAFSMICYICMGWCIIAVLKATVSAITLNGFIWLLVGGIFYTIGAVLYGIGSKKRYFHTVFHIFVDLGSIFQAICIIFYVI